jgi:uncharacterized protein YndB with AHSA1/START domain
MKKLYLLAKKGVINEKAPVIDKQEIMINAPIEKVWEILANIGEWPEWYTGVTIEKKPEKYEEGQTFHWKQDGNKIKSRLAKIERPNTLAWTGSVLWIKAVHVWQLREIEKSKTKVAVAESMQGFFISQFINKEKLHKVLDLWLNLLKIRVERNNPTQRKTVKQKKTTSRYSNMLRGIHVLS